MTEENSQDQEIAEDVVAYEDMPWQKLKALMTAEGQEWVNAEHAIEYLTKLDADLESEISEEVADTTSDAENSSPSGTEESTDAVTHVDTSSEVDAQADAGEDDITDEADIVDDGSLVTDPEDNIPCFDPDDKHGVISGQCNARYWQGGCHFDSQGQYIAPEDVVIESEETD